jgi:hypothetical protein
VKDAEAVSPHVKEIVFRFLKRTIKVFLFPGCPIRTDVQAAGNAPTFVFSAAFQ